MYIFIGMGFLLIVVYLLVISGWSGLEDWEKGE
jgi:hypothetical protein